MNLAKTIYKSLVNDNCKILILDEPDLGLPIDDSSEILINLYKTLPKPRQIFITIHSKIDIPFDYILTLK